MTDPPAPAPDDYIAWAVIKRRADHVNGDRTWLALCDSDTPGAFRVYGQSALAARDAKIEKLRGALRDVRQCGIADQCEECSHAIDAALAAERKDTP